MSEIVIGEVTQKRPGLVLPFETHNGSNRYIHKKMSMHYYAYIKNEFIYFLSHPCYGFARIILDGLQSCSEP